MPGTAEERYERLQQEFQETKKRLGKLEDAMIKADDDQLHSVIAIALLREQEADVAHKRMLETLKTIENRTLESEKSLKDLMGQYINRLYEEAAFHQNKRWNRQAIIDNSVIAISVIILLISVGFACYVQGEKSGAAKAIPAVVQTAPAVTAETERPPAPPKKRHRPKPAPSVSPEADLEVGPEGIDPDPRQQPQ